MAEERDRLRTTFDEAASLYNETYDAEGYLRVLRTYSEHRSLNGDTRERLFCGIADLIDDDFDGPYRQGLPDHPVRGPQHLEGIPLQGRHGYADNQDVFRESGSPAGLAAAATSRRSIRLGGYDYSQSGAYFVTICAARRGLLFGWISNGRVVENANARIVRDCWSDLPSHYPHISLDAFVVMPNHIHGIIVLLDTFGAGLQGRAGFKPAPTGGDAVVDVGVRHGLPEIVRALKTYSARRINATRGTPGASVWQRGYYERIVRNERELSLTREYIASNPRNWRTDHEHN